MEKIIQMATVYENRKEMKVSKIEIVSKWA